MMYHPCGHPIEVEDMLDGSTRYFDGLEEITSATPAIELCPSCGKRLYRADLEDEREHGLRLEALAYAVRVQTAWAGMGRRAA